MVFTEDKEIADIAAAAGASVPFLRSKTNADDYATTADVLLEVLNEYERLGRYYDIGCCIYPVAALVSCERLREGYEKLMGSPTLAGVVPVLRFGYPIQRALKVVDHHITMIDPSKINTRSQDLEPAFHDAGQFYWFRVTDLRSARTLLGPRVLPLFLSATEAQDIDNLDDWRLAEIKFQCGLLPEDSSKCVEGRSD
jgi:pseudaminic acid cytidylyltransferase